MPHCPIVAQQEAEVMLPRKPNMLQYHRSYPHMGRAHLQQ
jgi:hypothetical protein